MTITHTATTMAGSRTQTEHGAVLRTIAAVELPACDPVSRGDDPLRKLRAE